MNEHIQELIVKELGLIGTIALIGTILVTCTFPENITAITLLFGAVTSIIGALAAFLNTKNMSEKEAEILEQQVIERNSNMDGGEDVQ